MSYFYFMKNEFIVGLQKGAKMFELINFSLVLYVRVFPMSRVLFS